MARDPNVTLVRPDRDHAVGNRGSEELGARARDDDIELSVPQEASTGMSSSGTGHGSKATRRSQAGPAGP